MAAQSIDQSTTQRIAHRPVGIEKIWAYPCSLSLDMADLARARGEEPNYPADTLLVYRRALNPVWEDPVTMAVNAAKPMLSEQDLEDIQLLIVGTESSPDFGKPITTFVHRFLGMPDNCRNFEIKHACYGGTGAVMMAAHWVASGAAPGAKALVISTDQARLTIGDRHEFVMGAGAVAMLISDQPKILEYELTTNGYFTDEVGDTFRPTSRHEAGNTESSIYCYLDALEGAYADFERKMGKVNFDEDFTKHLYHTPFGGMVKRAHRTMLRKGRRVGRREADENFSRKVLPGLHYNAQVGGTYGASTFFSLMGTVDTAGDVKAGDQISIFAYGSGSCAEFYRATIGPEAHDRITAVQLQKALDARYGLTIEQYEAVEKQRTSYIDEPTYEVGVDGLDDWYRRAYAGQGRLVLRGLEGFFRNYDWS